MYFRNFFLLLITIYGSNSGFFTSKEKVVASLTFLETCPIDESSAIEFWAGRRKINRTASAISYKAKVKEAVGETMRIKAKLLNWSDGGWKYHGINVDQKDPCKLAHVILKDIWKNILEAGNVTLDCPIPVGYYEGTDIVLDWSNAPFIFTGGRYRLEVDVEKNKKLLMCARAEFEAVILPK